jgi:DNA-binding beta-propeller fold protein YncE
MLPKSGARYGLFVVVVGVALVSVVGLAQRSGMASGMPVFQVDPAWPKLPNDWVLGVTSSVATDRRDHVWIFHRPRSVPDAMKGRAAPAVLEFDQDGKFVNAWGGPGQGYDWPDSEHGIAVDHKDAVWLTGSSATTTPSPRSDDMILKFNNQGKFLMQIGSRSQSKGNADTKNVRQSADVTVNPRTDEVFVADGYGNRRVIVFDAETGAFKRMWGAFGNKPEEAPPGPAGGPPPEKLDTEGPGAPQFSNPVHAVKISNDGLVYVADRSNRRIQVFTTEGKYINQVFINRAGPAGGSVAGLAFSPDQQFLYAADYGNSHIAVLNRKSLEILYQFGTRKETPGDFRGPHHIAVDSKGNLYVAEVNPGNRAQKFIFKGLSPTPPPNALTATQLSAGQ